VLHVLLAAALVFWVASLLIVVLTLSTTPRLTRSLPAGLVFPRLSIIVPARNEERQIGRAVSSFLAQDYPDYEVIVVNDRSTDRTGAILASLPDPARRLRIIEGAPVPPGWLGKPHALAQGARAAAGDFLLFVDADVVYHHRTLREAVATLEALHADFLCIGPRMESRGFWENVLMPYVMWAFFAGPGFLANRDRPNLFAAGGGAGNLIRRKAYEAIGGHERLKDSVVDDVRLAFAARAAGFRTRAVRAEDRVSVRMYEGFREVCDGFTKNIAYCFEGLLGLLLALVTAATIVFAVAPPAVLLAAALGIPVAPGDLALAGAATTLMFVTRLLLAAFLGDPLWPSLTHPLMVLVWAGIIGRSLYYRIVRRRLSWRGREFDARAARF
jgi:chlorobactene glucosyltransferase